MTQPATAKQLTFVRSLLAERAGQEEAEALRGMLNVIREQGALNRRLVSAMIDELIKLPRNAEVAGLEDGMYRDDDESIFKVYHTVHGANVQVAKRLVCDALDGWEFVYEGKSGLRNLRPEHRMSLEQAKEFGAVYGVCCVCSATLTNEVSIAAGIGPVCGNRV